MLGSASWGDLFCALLLAVVGVALMMHALTPWKLAPDSQTSTIDTAQLADELEAWGLVLLLITFMTTALWLGLAW